MKAKAQTAPDRCKAEIEAITEQLLSGSTDMHGLLLALQDWSAELKILEQQNG